MKFKDTVTPCTWWWPMCQGLPRS